MSSNYYTPFVDGPAEIVNAALLNGRMGQLDAAIGNLANAVTAIGNPAAANGTAVTQANGAASAGQKVVTVDDSSKFVANTPVEYLLVGGAVEYNRVGSVDSSTQITLTTNIGTGGIPNNGIIAAIPEFVYAMLADTTNALEITRTANNEAILVNGNLSGADLFAHAVADNTNFQSTGTGAYCSFDARAEMAGSLDYNHFYGFEARNIFSGSGSLDTYTGLISLPTFHGAVTSAYGLWVKDPLGVGALTNNVGLFIDALTRGSGTNFAIYTSGATPSFHEGRWQTGADIIAGTTVTGTNLWVNSGSNSVGVGLDQSDDAYLATQVGHSAGKNLTDGSSNCTLVGTQAGYTMTTGDNNTCIGALAGRDGNGTGNVFLGYQAGRRETGSNTFMVDNQDRGSEAYGRTGALIYGVFNATVGSQELTFNCGKMGFFNTVAVAKPTGVAVSAAGIHAALVTLGLIAA